MSVFKTTFSRALAVIPTDNANIPYPAADSVGVNTSLSANGIIDSAAKFVTNGVKTGDIIYNTSDGSAATVLTVISETQLTLNADIFTATGKNYTVYQASSQSTIGNTGCFLYVGGTGNVKVTTIGNDIVTFSGVQAGTVLPVQVLKVHSSASGTTANLINALW